MLMTRFYIRQSLLSWIILWFSGTESSDGERDDSTRRPVSLMFSGELYLNLNGTSEGVCVHSGQAVAIIMFILGLGSLLPWNFFVTASQVSPPTPSSSTSSWVDNNVEQFVVLEADTVIWKMIMRRKKTRKCIWGIFENVRRTIF